MRAACGDREFNLATIVEDRLSLCRQFLHEVGGLERKGLRGVPKLKRLLDSELSFLRTVSSNATFVNESVGHDAVRITSCYRVNGRPLMRATCQAPTCPM